MVNHYTRMRTTMNCLVSRCLRYSLLLSDYGIYNYFYYTIYRAYEIYVFTGHFNEQLLTYLPTLQVKMIPCLQHFLNTWR